MRVLVTGAYGLIGSACLAGLHAAGHDVVGAGRSIGAARRQFPYAQWLEADFLRLQDAEAWQPLLGNIDAVVNCVGVLQDGWRDDVERIQFAGTVALFDGCARAGIRRVVQISALGADAAGPSMFSRTKAAAEAHLKTLTLDWVILRPALVLGSAVYGGTAMLRGIAAVPFVVPVFHGDSRIQIVSLDDLAETVVRSIAPGAPARVSWQVAHPQVHELADIVTAIRGWLGFPPRRVIRLPDAFAKVVGFIGDAIGWLGWRSPARATRSRNSPTVSSAIRRRGWRQPAFSQKVSTSCSPRGQPMSRIAGSRGFICSSRWRLSDSPPRRLAQASPSFFHCGGLRPARSEFLRIVCSLYCARADFWRVCDCIWLSVFLFVSRRELSLIGLLALTVLQAAHYCVTTWHLGYMPLAAISAIPIMLAILFTSRDPGRSLMELIFIFKFVHLIGASVLFGTGLGIAFFMFMANRTGHAGVIAVTARFVVIADFVFTATSVVVQPLSGFALAWAIGLSPFEEPWIVYSLVLYVLIGLCWLPVIFIQIRMRNLAQRRGRQCKAAARRISPPVPHLVLARLAGFHRRYRHILFDDLAAAALLISSAICPNFACAGDIKLTNGLIASLDKRQPRLADVACANRWGGVAPGITDIGDDGGDFVIFQ